MVYLAALLFGIAFLVKGADLFVDGASDTARRFGIPPLLVGMVIVGFGTSTPELLVSAISAADGAAGIALGNAWGSNIANIALILGITALVRPVTVQSGVIRTELPILLAVSVLAGWQALDLVVSRTDAAVLLTVFAGFIFWSVRFQNVPPADPLVNQARKVVDSRPDGRSVSRSVIVLFVGLLLLVVASRAVVWGAVGLARAAGVADLLIGLTIVAVGTSLPELASSIAAIRKGEDEIAFGNVVGSNIFNTLMVVGVAGMISPIPVEHQSVVRDLPVMGLLTIVMLLFGIGIRGRAGRINRVEAGVLCALYLAYLGWLIYPIARLH